MRITTSVGSAAFEVEFCSVKSGLGADGNAVTVGGVPSDTHINAIKSAAPGHERFTGQLLFTGAAKVDDGAGKLLLDHFRFNADGSAHMGDTQQVVAAALAGAAGFNGLLLGLNLLAHTGKRIVFTQEANYGVAGTIGGFDGGGNAAHTDFYVEALVFQHFCSPFAGLDFQISNLRGVPDFQLQLFQSLAFGGDGV